MDSSHACAIFNKLFANEDGFSLSINERKKKNIQKQSFVYGEINLYSFRAILTSVNPQKGEKLFDMGSGIGKAVIAAHLFFDFSEVVGIEILEDLYNRSQQILNSYKKNMMSNISASKKGQYVRFIHGDFLDADISETDIVYVASTCFDHVFMKHLSKKLGRSLKAGSRVITLTKKLHHDMLELRNTKSFPMSWGSTTVYFYEKI